MQLATGQILVNAYRRSGFGCRQVSDYLTNQVDLVPALKLGHYGFYD